MYISSAYGLKCFTCSYAKSDGIEGEECIAIPDTVKAGNKITSCDKKYCTITRLEKSGSKTVESIIRTCENKPHVSTSSIQKKKLNKHKTFLI